GPPAPGDRRRARAAPRRGSRRTTAGPVRSSSFGRSPPCALEGMRTPRGVKERVGGPGAPLAPPFPQPLLMRTPIDAPARRPALHSTDLGYPSADEAELEGTMAAPPT